MLNWLERHIYQHQVLKKGAVSSFQALTPFVENMFKQIQSRVDIEFVNYHPYANAKELQAEVGSNGKNESFHD